MIEANCKRPKIEEGDLVRVLVGEHEGHIYKVDRVFENENYGVRYQIFFGYGECKLYSDFEIELVAKKEDQFMNNFLIDCFKQEAKADNGKPKITLVPRQIIWDIAEVREYGNKKYGSPDNWRNVEVERYRDALLRHTLKYLDDPESVDEESGIKHLKHMACNIAFLCEMEDKDE